MMEKCFALKLNVCGALDCDCPGFENCPFYQTREQVDEARKKALERITSLPYLQQVYIAATYYGGKMPWKEKAATGDV